MKRKELFSSTTFGMDDDTALAMSVFQSEHSEIISEIEAARRRRLDVCPAVKGIVIEMMELASGLVDSGAEMVRLMVGLDGCSENFALAGLDVFDVAPDLNQFIGWADDLTTQTMDAAKGLLRLVHELIERAC